jgi:hypothetical protein
VTSRLPIGQLLIQSGRIDGWQLRSALAHQRRWGGRLGEALVGLGFVSGPVLLAELSRQLGVPYVELGERYVPPAIVRLLPEKLVRFRKVFPIALASSSRRGPIVIATSEPQNLGVLDEVAFSIGMRVKPVLASAGEIERAIDRHLCALDVATGVGAVELARGARRAHARRAVRAEGARSAAPSCVPV